MNALLSIRPKFAQAILGGEKRFEFRKRGFNEVPSKVFIYETAPTSRIVGYFTVDSVIRDTPDALWNACEDAAGIERAEYDAYFADSAGGLALVVGETTEFDQPVSLSGVVGGPAPQSYRWLDESTSEAVIDAAFATQVPTP